MIGKGRGERWLMGITLLSGSIRGQGYQVTSTLARLERGLGVASRSSPTHIKWGYRATSTPAGVGGG